MSIRERLSGNEAAAYAMKQINPDVVAALNICGRWFKLHQAQDFQ